MSQSSWQSAFRAAAVLSTLFAGASSASAATGPVQQSFPGAATYGAANYSADPAGSNDWNCRPTAARPYPVVLVHGTSETKYMNWALMSPVLKTRGLCVYAIAYGDTTGKGPAGDPIANSAKQLATFVDQVLAQTGASKVDIVGHSQGGMMPRQYIKFEGGANKVRNLVAISPTNHGTTLNGLGTLGRDLGLLGFVAGVGGQASADQVTGSAFLKNLNAGGLTVPSVKYTNIVTKYDEVVTPYSSGYITAADNPARASVVNVPLQAGCGTNFADHLSISYSKRTIWYVQRALGVASSTTPPCDVQLPLF